VRPVLTLFRYQQLASVVTLKFRRSRVPAHPPHPDPNPDPLPPSGTRGNKVKRAALLSLSPTAAEGGERQRAG